MNRRRLVSCLLLNIAATPGLGSLVARQWIVGSLQMGLSLAGFSLMLVWFYRLVVVQFYGQINGPVKTESVGWLAIVGISLFGVAWIWSLFTSLSLMRRAKAEEVAKLKNFTASGIKLDETKIVAALVGMPQWKREGQIVSRTFEFTDFVAAMKFVNAVAESAEAAQHHPDVDIRWNKVTLAFTTHDAGGLTEKDFALARQCDALSLR